MKLGSPKEIRDEHPENICDISSTKGVLKLDKSIDFNLLQFKNNPFILETEEVSKFEI
jgi:hypothetical protein